MEGERMVNPLLCCFFEKKIRTKYSPFASALFPSIPSNASVNKGRHKSTPLLPHALSDNHDKKCIVVDLDETLIHSSFTAIEGADFQVPICIDSVSYQVFVMKRPYLDLFLEKIGQLFECILFTASLSRYAEPVSRAIDEKRVFKSKLFREACVYYRGNYIKDLSLLGRKISQVFILDNSPISYFFNPDNAIPISSWFGDRSDTALLDLIPKLERLSLCKNVSKFVKNARQEKKFPL